MYNEPNADIRAVFEALRPLEGVWRGRGEGDYPTLEPFQYEETHRFEFDSAYPIIHFIQKVVVLPDKVSHWESGFIRILPDGRIEMNNAQDNGRLEVLRGAIVSTPKEGLRLELDSVGFANDPRMIQSRRTITIVADVLRYEMDMKTNLTDPPAMHRHLSAELIRSK